MSLTFGSEHLTSPQSFKNSMETSNPPRAPAARFLAILRHALAGFALLSSPLLAEELRVAVASNFVPVLTRLAPAFEAETGHKLILIGGATGQHYTQIINGAPFDVFLSADAERPQLLEERGLIVAGTRFTYALGKLVLWSVNPDLVDANGTILATGNYRHLAMANPLLAPYGKAAQEVLTKLGLWESIQERLVQGQNITQTLQFVHTGNAELGFIAGSQWRAIDPELAGSHWEIPAHLHTPIIQQGVLLDDLPAARDFFNFMQQADTRALIQSAGYEVP